VLAVTADSVIGRANGLGFVPKLGAVRRIQALLAVGHRHEDITAAMLTANPAVGTRSQMVLHQRGIWIARDTRDAVCAAYDQLAMVPGLSGKTRRLAAKYGYAPPLAWDDDSLDDPNGQPHLGVADEQLDEVAVERIMAGTLRETGFHNSPERIEAIRRLVESGWTDREVGDRVGISKDAVLKIRARKDIPAAMPTGRTA
jgi:hypothetical protein